MSNAGQKYMARVAQLPCCLCGTQPVEVHHIRSGQGMSQRSSDFLTVPLCPDCHRGTINGVHGQAAMLKVRKINELGLLAETIEKLVGGN